MPIFGTPYRKKNDRCWMLDAGQILDFSLLILDLRRSLPVIILPAPAQRLVEGDEADGPALPALGDLILGGEEGRLGIQ